MLEKPQDLGYPIHSCKARNVVSWADTITYSKKKNLKNINGLYLILFRELLLGKESSELDSFDHVFKTRIASPPREQDLIFYDRAIAIATIFWKKSDIPKYQNLFNFERCCMTACWTWQILEILPKLCPKILKKRKVGKASSNSSPLKSFINNFSRAVRSWSWCDTIFNLSHSYILRSLRDLLKCWIEFITCVGKASSSF